MLALHRIAAGFGGPEVAIHDGPHIMLFLTSYEARTSIGVESQFFIRARLSGVPWEIGINIIALMWTIALVKSMRVDWSDVALTV